jgi:hypothetical protein
VAVKRAFKFCSGEWNYYYRFASTKYALSVHTACGIMKILSGRLERASFPLLRKQFGLKFKSYLRKIIRANCVIFISQHNNFDL